MAETASYVERELELATGKIKFLEEGNGSPVVILHHSWGAPGWLPFHDRLVNAGARVIVPDMPGWAGSERPAWAREPRDIAIIISRMLAALELADVKLVGFGFGGYVAAELASMNNSRLAALVLVGAAGVQPKEGEILDQMMLSHRKYVEESFRNAEAYTDYMGEEPPDDVRDLWDFSREMTARVTWKPYMFNRRLEPLLGDMRTPTLLVWGKVDKVVPLACAQQYHDALPDSTLVVVEDAGHVVELEQPERLATLVSAFPKEG